MTNNIKKYIAIIIAVIIIVIFVGQIKAKDILVSFDGSGYFDMWEDTLLFAKDYNLKYTYFVSAPYFITEKECKEYPYWALAELKTKPYCKIQKDENINSVIRRRMYAKIAIDNGHEIASHLCGHYDGKNWTYDQWIKEMEFFGWAMEKTGFKEDDIVGIRTPYLSHNEAYWKATWDRGWLYDSSDIYGKDKKYWARREIPIKGIMVVVDSATYVMQEGNRNYYTLPFDDAFKSWLNNHYYKDITNEDIEQIYFNSLYYEYMEDGDYPLQICLHFEQINNSAYFNAFKRFVKQIEDEKPHYMTYKEYAERME